MRSALAFFALVLALLPAAPPARAASPAMDATEAGEEITVLSYVRLGLQRSVGAQETPPGDYVSVTIFGGDAPPAEITYTAIRGTDGLWSVEKIIRPQIPGTLERGRPERGAYALSQDASKRLDEALADPNLFTEPMAAAGNCMDSTLTGVNVHLADKDHMALRAGCADPDRVTALIADVLAQPTLV